MCQKADPNYSVSKFLLYSFSLIECVNASTIECYGLHIVRFTNPVKVPLVIVFA